MKLPENLRDEFKKPLGKLILDKDTTKQNILKEISNDALIITVGDATTQKLLDYDIVPSIQVVDGFEKRNKREPPQNKQTLTDLYCNNPAGEISEESLDTIKKAFDSQKPVRILVNGEEDLLVIPICLESPANTVVMYGQPNEGLVVVHVDAEVKNKTKSLLELMK